MRTGWPSALAAASRRRPALLFAGCLLAGGALAWGGQRLGPLRDAGPLEQLRPAPAAPDIEPWQVLPVPPACAAPDADLAPGDRREFVYSPAVGRAIDGPDATRSVTAAEVAEVRRTGYGVLEILGVDPGVPRDGCPTIGRLRFRLELFGER